VINDVLAIAYLLQPEVLTFSDLRLRVDLDDGQSRGRTKVDPKGSFAASRWRSTPLPCGGCCSSVCWRGAPLEEALA